MKAVFRSAGWYEGRDVVVDPAVPSDHPAWNVLAELGGLELEHPARNMTKLSFEYVDTLKPDLSAWETALGTNMVGIAEQDGGHGEMYLTDTGHVIGGSLMHHAFWFEGRTFEKAIEAIGRGEQSRPMLLPNQTEVILYGIVHQHGDPAVLGPGSPEFN